VVLLVGAGLLARSLWQLSFVDPGFRAENVLTMRVQLPDRANADVSRGSRFFAELVERIETLPGVRAAGAVTYLPFTGETSGANFFRNDRPMPAPGQIPSAQHSAVMPGYFKAMGIPLLRGRLFTKADGEMPPLRPDMASMIAFFRTADPKVVINDAMARRFWPNEDPLGRTFQFGPPSLQGPVVTIIGVVGNARQRSLEQPAEPHFFFSAHHFPVPFMRVVVRTSGNPLALAATIRGLVNERERNALVLDISAMDRVMADWLSGRRNNVILLGAFSAIALLLTAVGLYGTTAYLVAQRRREIGVRMAMGAAGAQIRAMVLHEGVVLAMLGVGLGLVIALALSRVVATMLYGVTTKDTITYLAAALLLAGVTVAANLVPAWRASRVDPLAALRIE
jgi:predicted permease